MICTVTLRHDDGRVVTLETALDDVFLERMFPDWRVVSVADLLPQPLTEFSHALLYSVR